MNNRVVLMILDGWGIAKDKNVSAIDKANTPFIDSLYNKYPHNTLDTSGMEVGLPDGQMGNSEVGHMNLGAGRVVYQSKSTKLLKTVLLVRTRFCKPHCNTLKKMVKTCISSGWYQMAEYTLT